MQKIINYVLFWFGIQAGRNVLDAVHVELSNYALLS